MEVFDSPWAWVIIHAWYGLALSLALHLFAWPSGLVRHWFRTV